MVLGAPGHQLPHFDGFIYIRYAATLFTAHISAIYLLLFGKFGWVPFTDIRVRRLATKQNTEFTEGARKLRSYFNPFVSQSS